MLQHICTGADADGLAPGQQTVGADAGGGVDVGGHRKDIPPLFQRQPGYIQGAAALRGLDADGAERQPGEQAVAHGKVIGQMGRAGRILAEHCAAGGCVLQQTPAVVRAVIGHIHTARSDAHQRPSGF